MQQLCRVALTTCLVLAATTGCTDEDDPPTPGRAAVPDACRLLADADLTAAFGSAPGTGQSGGGTDRRICTYSTGLVVGAARGEQYPGFVRTTRSNPDADCEPLTGVGDEAVMCVIYGTVGQFAVRIGDLMYDVSAPVTRTEPYVGLVAKLQR